ncbi:hypothetical protein, partial [Planktothrix sp.]|uniref:hypothetical protein n=1 Tax=Planktothrix sp. TaxID=3088171 RepID=UPI0038D45949
TSLIYLECRERTPAKPNGCGGEVSHDKQKNMSDSEYNITTIVKEFRISFQELLCSPNRIS